MRSLLFIGLIIPNIITAQMPVPVSWKFKVKKTVDKTYDISISAAIDEGWHIYAQRQPAGAKCKATKIVFERNPLVSFCGVVKEMGKKLRQSIPGMEIEQDYCAGEVLFVQAIKLRAAVRVTVSGSVTFQACTENECLLPRTMPFSVEVK